MGTVDAVVSRGTCSPPAATELHPPPFAPRHLHPPLPAPNTQATQKTWERTQVYHTVQLSFVNVRPNPWCLAATTFSKLKCSKSRPLTTGSPQQPFW